ncbi:tetratricopeptide repeat protein [Streptomyces sp. NPDC001552]|uniref:tetratricopeptide repeat protein n=1 Tax=Streptomyces sp. NPDC001552 TaxID=3364587 RepID=UPI0036A5F18D
MLTWSSVDLADYLAGEPKQYIVNPLEYFAARVRTLSPMLMAGDLTALSLALSSFLQDEDLPTEYVDHFLGKLHEYCLEEHMPAAANVFWLLNAMKSNPRVQAAVERWREEGLYARLEALAEQHHESLSSLLAADSGLRSTVRMKHSMYLPPGMAGGPAPIIIGRQEQDQRARASEKIERGLAAETNGDFAVARDFYESAAQLNPRDRDIAFAHAQIYLHLDNPERSAQMLGELCATVPRSARFQSALGSALAAAGQPEEALAALDRALDVEPDRTAAVANKATVLNQLGRQVEAAELLVDAFNGEPPFQPGPEMAAGLSLTMMKSMVVVMDSPDLELADRLAQHLCDLSPQDPLAWELRAQVAVRDSRPADALSHYSTTLDLDPKRASAARACLSLASAGEQRQAVVTVVRRYLAAVPQDGKIWNDLGYLLTQLGDTVGAVECYRQAAHHVPDDALHWTNLGGILLQARQSIESLREGVSYLDRALQLRPDHLPARFNRAAGLLLLGEFRRAEEEFAEILRQDPNFPQAADLLVVCRQARSGDAESD